MIVWDTKLILIFTIFLTKKEIMDFFSDNHFFFREILINFLKVFFFFLQNLISSKLFEERNKV